MTKTMENKAEYSKAWWVSTSSFTVFVRTRGNIIIEAAPIVRKWIGQSFSRFVSYYNAEKVDIADGQIRGVVDKLD